VDGEIVIKEAVAMKAKERVLEKVVVQAEAD